MRILLLMLLLSVGVSANAQTPFATFDRASASDLSDPYDLTIGPDGQLYVADSSGSRIVVMDPDTLEITGVVGVGDLPGARDISFCPDGKAYVAVAGANAVAVYDFDAGAMTFETFLGPFARTEGVLAHSNGQLYVMASGAGQIVGLAGGKITAIVSGLFWPHDLAESPDGSIWVADTGRQRLVRYSTELEQLQVIEAAKFGFAGPRYLDVDDFGRLVVSDQDAHRVLLINPQTGDLLGSMGNGTPGLGPYQFSSPEGVVVSGNRYYVADRNNNRVVKYVVLVN
jgi:DNA-binding beta-propeller fold protein YncE